MGVLLHAGLRFVGCRHWVAWAAPVGA